jgi:hypothetical protein
MLVKLAGSIMQCVHEQGAGTDQFCSLTAAQQRVLQQGAAQLLALGSPVDGQSTQHDHRYRVGHVLPHGTCGLLLSDGTRCQGVVAHDLIFLIRDSEGTAGPAGLVGQRPAF